MFTPDENGVFAEVHASSVRRVFACVVIYGLGAMIIYMAFAQPPTFGYLLMLIALGTGILLLGERLRKATRGRLVLTQTGVFDQDGNTIALISDIVGVERGAFAMKPSNGFTLRLRSKQPRTWAPGLWWRLGRRVGVGGVTAAGQSKFMAEQIALRLAMQS